MLPSVLALGDHTVFLDCLFRLHLAEFGRKTASYQGFYKTPGQGLFLGDFWGHKTPGQGRFFGPTLHEEGKKCHLPGLLCW